jgi:hypothetical protein
MSASRVWVCTLLCFLRAMLGNSAYWQQDGTFRQLTSTNQCSVGRLMHDGQLCNPRAVGSGSEPRYTFQECGHAALLQAYDQVHEINTMGCSSRNFQSGRPARWTSEDSPCKMCNKSCSACVGDQMHEPWGREAQHGARTHVIQCQ